MNGNIDDKTIARLASTKILCEKGDVLIDFLGNLSNTDDINIKK